MLSRGSKSSTIQHIEPLPEQWAELWAKWEETDCPIRQLRGRYDPTIGRAIGAKLEEYRRIAANRLGLANTPTGAGMSQGPNDPVVERADLAGQPQAGGSRSTSEVATADTDSTGTRAALRSQKTPGRKTPFEVTVRRAIVNNLGQTASYREIVAAWDQREMHVPEDWPFATFEDAIGPNKELTSEERKKHGPYIQKVQEMISRDRKDNRRIKPP